MTDNTTANEILGLVERAERLEAEKQGIADDIKDVYSEAKSRGFDPKALRKIVAIRKKKREVVEEENAILHVYCDALGMQYALL